MYNIQIRKKKDDIKDDQIKQRWKRRMFKFEWKFRACQG